jgi:acetyl esterase
MTAFCAAGSNDRLQRKVRWLIAAAVVAFSSVGEVQAAPPREVRDLGYGSGTQTLDLFVPTANAKKTALLFIHGGGFREGDKSQLFGIARLYAEGGFLTATMNYRLAPANPYPAAVNDVKAAIAWLRTQTTQFGFAAQRVVLVGYSAGGTLALSAGLSTDTNVAAIVSAAAPVDLNAWAASISSPQAKIDVSDYLKGTRSQDASPLYAVRAGAPPVFLFHGEADNLVPISQSVLIADKFKAAKVPVLFRTIPAAGHDILLNPTHLKIILNDLTPFLVTVDQQP